MGTASWELPNPLNINISAYRVLYILLLLVRHRSLNMNELNQYLFDNRLIERIYNGETLTKYVNTLRKVGCRIPRSSSRNDYNYELEQNPFPLALSADDMLIANKTLSLLARQSDERLFEGYGQFMEKILWCSTPLEPAPEEGADGEAQGEMQLHHPGGGPDEEMTARRALLRQYRRYCEEAFLLEILVQGARETSRSMLLEPHEVLEKKGKLFLLGLEQRTHEKKMLNLDRILSVRQLPSKMQRGISETNVLFELYGRLAETYRLYPDEKIIARTPGKIQVRAKVREVSLLMGRLLKYGSSCQILSPGAARDKMRERIEAMYAVLKTQNEPDTVPN